MYIAFTLYEIEKIIDLTSRTARCIFSLDTKSIALFIDKRL